MRPTFRLVTVLSALLVAASSAAAQEPQDADTTGSEPPSKVKERLIVLQHFRPQDQRGLNIFETPKEPGVEYTGFRVDFGAAFATQVQSLKHENAAAPNVVNGVNANQLADIGFGFNNSTANLSLHAQLAPGIRVQLTSYLSSRHHNETWVKDGYLLVDQLPIDLGPLNLLMNYVTLRAGHFEINYGDAHFRRSDNGNAMYNPFVGNYIMDAFTTEVGAEVYVRSKGVIAMGSVTGGEVRGTVLSPEQRSPSYIGKLGIDRKVRPDLRVRVTGSLYKNDKTLNNTLYGGDRAGSRYYFVVENTAATESAQFTSGQINPGFRNQVTATQLNPFVKFRGLELFGVVERASGRAATEATKREFRQYALDTVYRFFDREQAYVGARYNRVEGELSGISGEVAADRWQLAGGWFVIPSVLMKAEYVAQEFTGYPVNHIRNGGKFHGFMLEGVIGF
jgi:hypothetical protein